MDQTLAAFLESYHMGTSTEAYRFLGCHPESRQEQDGYVFRVWAPHAHRVCLVGDFNHWEDHALPLEKISRGVWEIWSDQVHAGDAYKYLITHYDGNQVYKSDPVGFRTCRAPDTSSVVTELGDFRWHDGSYLSRRCQYSALDLPLNIYELHLGSWRRKEDGSICSYGELAPELADYVKNMGYTHVELMPLGEYAYGPSWGYGVTGFYAPTSRYGSPRELMTLIDHLHRAGIGVILDWEAAHFPKDLHGLYEFDGTCTYELSDPQINEHPDWNTRIFDLGKPEVRSFLISNAVFWLKHYHIDGLRVSDVSSMLYLDYNRPDFKPNRYGGRENLAAADFLRQLNRACFAENPGVIMAADDSTAYPLVTKPDYVGGLGFLFKWHNTWAGDTLNYFREDPINRKYHHDVITQPMDYAYAENYILPLSHDHVVYGQGSLISKMPGEYDLQFSGLRLLLGYQMALPGKKLLFMGGEFGQFIEWNHTQALDWLLLGYERHRQMQCFTRDLNRFYLQNTPLWSNDTQQEGFSWIQKEDAEKSILAFRRIDRHGKNLICVLNFTPVERRDYLLGLPEPGSYRCVLCSDDRRYGGSTAEADRVTAQDVPFLTEPCSGLFRIPPMSVSFYTLD